MSKIKLTYGRHIRKNGVYFGFWETGSIHNAKIIKEDNQLIAKIQTPFMTTPEILINSDYNHAFDIL